MKVKPGLERWIVEAVNVARFARCDDFAAGLLEVGANDVGEDFPEGFAVEIFWF